MRAVDQTTFGGEDVAPQDRGNCMQAAVASILNLPLEEVPHFAAAEGDWWTPFQGWLRARGLQCVVVPYDALMEPPMIYHIVVGVSPRGLSHSVVYRGDELEFDPHPAGGGVAPSRRYLFATDVVREGSTSEPPMPASTRPMVEQEHVCGLDSCFGHGCQDEGE